MPYLVENERAKLTSNALDRASTACLGAGVLVPIGAATLNPTTQIDTLLIAVLAWLVPTIILHIEARRVLTALRE